MVLSQLAREDGGINAITLGGGHFGLRNELINGGMQVWQRGTSLSSYGGSKFLADRWRVATGGSTTVAQQRVITSGANKYALRVDVVTGGEAGSFCYVAQKIEDLRRFAGRTVTLSFDMWSDAAREAAIEFISGFGSGGSPTPQILGIGGQKFAVSTDRQRFAFPIEIPPLAGDEVFGTDGNDHLNFSFFFDSGSNFGTRHESLGNQSGTFYIADCQLEFGDRATAFEMRPYDMELGFCERYYQQFGEGCGGHVFLSNGVRLVGQFRRQLRGAPAYALLKTSFAFLQVNSIKNLSGCSLSFVRIDHRSGFRVGITNTGDTALTPGSPGHYYDETGPFIEFDAEF